MDRKKLTRIVCLVMAVLMGLSVLAGSFLTLFY